MPLIDPRRQRTAARALLGVIAVLAIATAVGLMVLWPRGEAPDTGAPTDWLHYPKATITALDPGECTSFDAPGLDECVFVELEITSGPTSGERASMQVAGSDFHVPDLDVGDPLVVQYNPLAPPEFAYSFWEFQRDTPLAALAIIFAVVVVAFGRWQGIRALAGLVISLGIILVFLLPALLRERPAVAVALVGASAIAFAALYLAHGVTLETSVALVGTMASLVLITTLASIFVATAHLTGLSGDDAQLLRVTAEALDPTGLLLAGIIIGALGVLDDVTVTQVAAVAELRAAGGAITNRELYRRAIRVGRDHIAATVNTLVLAYVGASLSLLLFFVQSGRGFGRTIGQEVIAIEVVRTLVGSIGLVAAVPVTTALAVVASRRTDDPSESTTGLGEPADRRPRWEDFAPEPE